MFLETSRIAGLVLAIDGFVRLGAGGERYKRGNGSYVLFSSQKDILILDDCFSSLLEALSQSKIPFRIVSKLGLNIVSRLLGSFYSLPQDDIFCAQNDIERAGFLHVISKARRSMGINANSCIFFGADLASLKQAQRARLGTILYRFKDGTSDEEYALSVQGADFNVYTENRFKRILAEQSCGYYGELISSRKPGDWSGAFLEIPSDVNDAPILVSGRYFKVHDVRHQKSPLSKRILEAKTYPSRHIESFSKIILPLVQFATKGNFDFITRVPLRPFKIVQKIPDRLKIVLDEASRKGGEYAIPSSKVDGDILMCVREYSPQHECSADKRRENVKGAFKVVKEEKVRNKIVVLLDDTLTTGSTMLETINVLYESGAKKVIPVALAFNVNDLISGSERLSCSVCNGRIFDKTKKDGGLFWGCENWNDGRKHDAYDYWDGVSKLNEMTNDFIEVDFEGLEEIGF